MSETLKWLAARMKEPSTWRAITIAGTALGVTISPEMIDMVLKIGGGIYTLILLVKKDASKF
jgi:hypothetical protein